MSKTDPGCASVRMFLTAARSAEVRLASWTEINTTDRVWTISAARMKAKREHRVPLCRRALEILDAPRTLGGGNRLVFPIRSGKAISVSTLPKMLQYHRIAAVAHGFRSSFRDWAAEETDHPREVIEAALAHVVQNKVEAAYPHAEAATETTPRAVIQSAKPNKNGRSVSARVVLCQSVAGRRRVRSGPQPVVELRVAPRASETLPNARREGGMSDGPSFKPVPSR